MNITTKESRTAEVIKALQEYAAAPHRYRINRFNLISFVVGYCDHDSIDITDIYNVIQDMFEKGAIDA